MDNASFKENCRKSPRYTSLFNKFSKLASGNDGVPIKSPQPNKDFINRNPKIKEFYSIHKHIGGIFDSHFFASIPYILEEECRLGSALLNFSSLQNDVFNIYTIGTAEATMARTLGRMGKGKIKTLSCSPNIENQKGFNFYGIPKHSFFHLGGFFEIDKKYLSKNKYFNKGFDLIVEDTTFQMYSPQRNTQIEFVKQILKENGILILIEKMNHENISQYMKMESIKDDYKKQFFSDFQIKKKHEVIDIMEKNQQTVDKVVESLLLSFDYVAIYWNSCNFYSLAASDSIKNLNDFFVKMPKQYLPKSQGTENLLQYFVKNKSSCQDLVLTASRNDEFILKRA